MASQSICAGVAVHLILLCSCGAISFAGQESGGSDEQNERLAKSSAWLYGDRGICIRAFTCRADIRLELSLPEARRILRVGGGLLSLSAAFKTGAEFHPLCCGGVRPGNRGNA